MSTFVDKAINPKTRQTQEAWFIDDFYGHHQYAVAFRRDGEDTVFSTDKISLDEYDVYPLHKVEALKTASNLTNNRSKLV